MSESDPPADLIAVVSDLIFGARIRSTADCLGLRACLVGSIASLRSILEHHRPSLILADLNAPDELGLQAILLAKSIQPETRLIGFVSHVDATRAEQGSAAGADEVMPRSRFHHQLPSLLRRYCLRDDGQSDASVAENAREIRRHSDGE